MNWKSSRKLWRQQLNKIKAHILTPLDYATWGVLEKRLNATSPPNIGLLKTAIEEEWNKISEECFEGALIQWLEKNCVVFIFLFCSLFVFS